MSAMKKFSATSARIPGERCSGVDTNGSGNAHGDKPRRQADRQTSVEKRHVAEKFRASAA
ncbi:MAG: hypothetical protein BGP05_21365 [Rhizobiales bacterium 62-47]|nr:MAG: hypothetical protein BGP05_21365 [Rhizobiales bacterium 62-47]